MPDPLFAEIIGKMLAETELKDKIDAGRIERLRTLLTTDKLPTKAEILAVLDDKA